MNPRLKLIAIAGVLAGIALVAFTAAWSWRGAIADAEKADALKTQLDALTQALEKERKDRATFQTSMKALVVGMRADLGRIAEATNSASAAVAAARASNPAFYEQRLPEDGLDAWTTARQLPHSASSPR